MTLGFGSFEIGQKVQVKLKGWKKHFPGVISFFDESTKTYTVNFDDGEVHANVKAFHMRKVQSTKTGVNSASEQFEVPDGKKFPSRAEYRNYCVNKFYTLSGKVGEEVTIESPQISGNVFYIKNVKDSVIKLLDYSEQVFVDNVSNSTVLIGPCSGSVFFRKVEDSVIFTATKQFRARDCKRCTCSLYSMTEPVIESSTELKFYPYMAAYANQSNHFKAANLNPEINHYANIFDYTNSEMGALGICSSASANFKVLDDETHWKELKIGNGENPVSNHTRTPLETTENNMMQMIAPNLSPKQDTGSRNPLVERLPPQLPISIEPLLAPDVSNLTLVPKKTAIIGSFRDMKNSSACAAKIVEVFMKSAHGDNNIVNQVFCEDLCLMENIKKLKVSRNTSFGNGEIRAISDLELLQAEFVDIVVCIDFLETLPIWSSGNRNVVTRVLQHIETYIGRTKNISLVRTSTQTHGHLRFLEVLKESMPREVECQILGIE